MLCIYNSTHMSRDQSQSHEDSFATTSLSASDHQVSNPAPLSL